MPITTRSDLAFTTTSGLRATRKFGTGAATLYLGDLGGTTEYMIWVKAPNLIKRGMHIQSAKLRIRNKTTTPGTTYTKARVLKNWSTSTITYNNRPKSSAEIGPSTNGVTLSSTGSPISGSLPAKSIVEFDVTADVNAMVNGTTKNYGWRIFTGSTGTRRDFYGKGSLEPVLIIQWAYPAETPVDPEPGTEDNLEAAEISHNYPVLTATYDADDNAADLVGVWIQAKLNDSNFASGVWNSGWINSTIPEINTADLAGYPIPASIEDTVYWRMRVKDSNNNESFYSDIVGYRVTPKPTIAFTEPAGSVGVPYPAIKWTSSAPLIQYNLQVYSDVNDDLSLVWESGLDSSAENEYEIPFDVITEVGKTYRLVGQFWDNFSRTAYLHDVNKLEPPYTEVSTTFVYALSTDVPPPSNLTVQYNAPAPEAKLTWSASPAPDSFEVVRNGKVIATDLEPNELLVGGSTFSWVDETPPPQGRHIWEVRSEVGGKTSANNPTKELGTTSDLAWLISKSAGVRIAIAGETPIAPVLYEQGAVFEPLNSKYPVRITRALGGYRGTATGTLCGECLSDGTTSRDLKNQMIRLRNKPGTPVRLFIDDISVKVVVFNINISPSYGPAFGKTYVVTFDFHEVA